MAQTTIRLPDSDGPDITIDRGAFRRPRVSVDGLDVAAEPGKRDSYAIPMADGTSRTIRVKSGWDGMAVIADDGSRLPLDRKTATWERILAFAPFLLIVVGGLLGGLFGGAAVVVNLAITRTGLGSALRVAAMIGTFALAAVLWFVVARAILIEVTPIPTYTVGQCLDGLAAEAAVDPNAIVDADCAVPHDAEVVGLDVVPTTTDDEAWPGVESLDAFAGDTCVRLFEAYVGTSYATSRYPVFYLVPSSDTWGRGDRQVVCIGIAPAGEQLTESIAGTAQ